MPPFLFFLIGFGALAYLLKKGDEVKRPTPSPKKPMKFLPNNAADWAGWVWPVPHFEGREPVVSHAFETGSRYLEDGSLNPAAHMGVDIMFKRNQGDPTIPRDTVAIPKNSTTNLGWIAPVGTPILAAGPGTIWRCGDSARGKWIQIDHGKVGTSQKGVNTYYQHLATFAKAWKKGDVVHAGELLGTMGGDPLTSAKLRHLHFELWEPVAGQNANDWPKDPVPVMKHWQKLQGAI